MAIAPTYRVDRLSFAYAAAPVLQSVSAVINPGEFVAIVGPNGAGKSTFLKILAGLLRTYSGVVEFNGSALGELSPRTLARTVAFVAQETHVVFPFTVGQMVLMGRLPHQSHGLFDSRIDVERAEEAMRSTETLHLAK